MLSEFYSTVEASLKDATREWRRVRGFKSRTLPKSNTKRLFFEHDNKRLPNPLLAA